MDRDNDVNLKPIESIQSIEYINNNNNNNKVVHNQNNQNNQNNNYNNNNNENDHYKLIKSEQKQEEEMCNIPSALVDFLLKYILQFLNSNVDRICLVLSSRTLFLARNRFLTFTFDTHPMDNWYNFERKFMLKSFKEILINSVVESSVTHGCLASNILLERQQNRTGTTWTPFNNNSCPQLLTTHSPSHEIVQETTHLKLEFDEPIGSMLIPPSVTQVHLSHQFNQLIPIGFLPPTVKSLILGRQFNQPLHPLALKSIAHLSCHRSSNLEQLFPNGLPTNLEHLEIQILDHPIKIDLKNVKHLFIGTDQHPLQRHPTTTTTSLSSSTSSTSSSSLLSFDNTLPPVVINKILDSSIESTHQIQYLTFTNCFNIPLAVGSIPRVSHVSFGWSFNHELPVGLIPDSVSHLSFGFTFNRPMPEHVIPESVTTLSFGDMFNSTLVLPKSVTRLTVGRNYKIPMLLKHCLQLRHLNLHGQIFNIRPMFVGADNRSLFIVNDQLIGGFIKLNDVTLNWDLHTPFESIFNPKPANPSCLTQ